ncbi:YdiU family protein [Thioclava litoralis]|uniref:Protein nucleotidyltransferase YdiU n=1 Tax=Thioclava litoralis TaxID=3076557 RepID=A0ABZ1DY02_9RHOB|nr:YdiU family protein [Thioclava sp. FTW29]
MTASHPIPFTNSYANLPERFFAPQAPTPVSAPALIAVNDALARQLGIAPDFLRSPEGVAMLAGNHLPEGAQPIAQAYAGHQFGGWVPQLGDGRAVLLGEVTTPQGSYDIQLKGAGPTPFSRRGDGRAWVGPVLREYVVSEAMAALGLPTTRALGAAYTGDTLLRDMKRRRGAVLARVARSHVRVGTFQYFAARGDVEALQILTDHVIAKLYPDCENALDLLQAVVAAQARLIAGWMSLGFIHGVMNTDNMAVSGETIDYGPCAFSDIYHPEMVFSSIDQYGRYAYGAQPQVALWNLAQFATCLVPLMGPQEAAVEQATAAINTFTPLYQAEWLGRFGRKIGIAEAQPEDLPLIQDFLTALAQGQGDFTRSFTALRRGEDAAQELSDPALLETWTPRWQTRLAQEADPQGVMAAANPLRIPRNHRVEAAIMAAEDGDLTPFETLMKALAQPYGEAPEFAAFEAAPALSERVIRTFCGT